MIFDVTQEHIMSLSDPDLRTLVGLLAEQEAISACQTTAGITYGGNQTAPDGGIDVRVNLGNVSIKGYIPRAQTGFQVKAEDMPESKIKAEMRLDGKLRPSIINLGKAEGAYIIVSSQSTVSDTYLTKRKNAMVAAIADESEASALYTDFYDCQRLVTWVNQHPGLIPWVRERVGLPLSGWRSFDDWSSSPGEIDEPYFIDDHTRLISSSISERDGLDATAGINKIREILEKPKGAIRLVGLSGVGKTRFAQALFDSKIGNNSLPSYMAVYADMSYSPLPSPLELLSHLQSLGKRCFLIVDNCGIKLHQDLVSRLKKGDGKVSILTIEYDVSDDEPENTDTFRLDPSSSSITEKVIKRRYKNLTAPEIQTISTFSEGNSRIALALASTAQNGDSLANLKNTDLIKRLFYQNQKENSTLWKSAKAFSLVYSFDGENLGGENSELPRLASLVGVSPADLYASHAELQRRQIIQKRAEWRALLPHALAHKLAKEALQDFPIEMVLNQLGEDAPPRLLKSFSRRLGCLHDSSEARLIVKKWLSPAGWLSEIDKFDENQIIVFENIAPVDPDSILDLIARDITKSGVSLHGYSLRNKILGLLRSLAYDPASFDKAVMLIANFIEKTDRDNSISDASNIFKSLFFIWLSGTHAPAEQRTKILIQIARSSMSKKIEIVLSGLDAMLECTHFSSSYSFEFGTRKRDYGLNPNTNKAFLDWYRQTFKVAAELATYEDFRAPVKKMIASQFRQLAAHQILTDDLIELADIFANGDGWPEGCSGVRSAIQKIKREANRTDIVKFESLEKRIFPNSLKDRIVSYILQEPWGGIDFDDEDLESENKFAKAQKKVELLCEDIGKEIAQDLSALKTYLPELLASNSERVRYVARGIGKYTSDWSATWEIILSEMTAPEAKDGLSNFSSSFISGLSEVKEGAANEILDRSLLDIKLHPYFVYMQVNAGVSLDACDRIIRATSIPTIPTGSFFSLGCGQVLDDLPAEAFKKIVLSIAEREGGIKIALKILHMRFFSKEGKKNDLEQEDIDTGRILLNKIEFEELNAHDDHAIALVIEKCLKSFNDVEIAENICKRILDGISKHKISARDYVNLISVLARKAPQTVLNILVEEVEILLKQGKLYFIDSGRHLSDAIQNITENKLLEWAREAPETRFLLLAETIKPWRSKDPNLNNDEGLGGRLEWTSTALRLLSECPNPHEVISKYIESFRPSSYSPPLSAILESRIPLLQELVTDKNLKISSVASLILQQYIENVSRQKDLEIKHDKERDERFEW